MGTIRLLPEKFLFSVTRYLETSTFNTFGWQVIEGSPPLFIIFILQDMGNNVFLFKIISGKNPSDLIYSYCPGKLFLVLWKIHQTSP